MESSSKDNSLSCPAPPDRRKLVKRKKLDQVQGKNYDNVISKKVCRKLDFDLNEEENDETPAEQSNFTAELENLINKSLEENRKRCIEKYNFDPTSETPLEGRYAWKKVEK